MGGRHRMRVELVDFGDYRQKEVDNEISSFGV